MSLTGLLGLDPGLCLGWRYVCPPSNAACCCCWSPPRRLTEPRRCSHHHPASSPCLAPIPSLLTHPSAIRISFLPSPCGLSAGLRVASTAVVAAVAAVAAAGAARRATPARAAAAAAVQAPERAAAAARASLFCVFSAIRSSSRAAAAAASEAAAGLQRYPWRLGRRRRGARSWGAAGGAGRRRRGASGVLPRDGFAVRSACLCAVCVCIPGAPDSPIHVGTSNVSIA